MYYNYNGNKILEFPKNLNTGIYPYLWMVDVGDYVVLEASDLPFSLRDEIYAKKKYNGNDSDLHCVEYKWIRGSKSWTGPSKIYTYPPGMISASTQGIPWTWSNYDVLYTFSSKVWRATYEPIPVPEIRIVDPLNLYSIFDYGYYFGSTSCMAFVEYTESGNRWAWNAEMTGHTSRNSRLLRGSETDCTFTIYLAPDEKASSVKVTVTSTEVENLSASQTFSVVPYNIGNEEDSGGGDGDNTEDPLITNIELFVFPDEVSPGEHVLASVVVEGTGEYDPDFTVEISGSTSSGTCFVKGSSYHNIWISKDETAEYILVTVRSVQDPTMSDTEMIYINHSGTDGGGNEAEQLRRAFFAGLSAGAAT